LKWEYEKEGYVLPNNALYWPDFWLPQVEMWAEVNPTDFCEADFKKAKNLVRLTNRSCILLDGLPACRGYWYISPEMVDLKIDPWECGHDVMISMHKDYPEREYRFYSNVGSPCKDDFGENGMFEDVPRAVEYAKSARFEFGESHC
jgi:hypothetical protein